MHIDAEGEAVAGGEKEIWAKKFYFILVMDNMTKLGRCTG